MVRAGHSIVSRGAVRVHCACCGAKQIQMTALQDLYGSFIPYCNECIGPHREIYAGASMYQCRQCNKLSRTEKAMRWHRTEMHPHLDVNDFHLRSPQAYPRLSCCVVPSSGQNRNSPCPGRATSREPTAHMRVQDAYGGRSR